MSAFDDLVLLLVDERLFLLREVAPQEEHAAAVVRRDEFDDGVGESIPANLRV